MTDALWSDGQFDLPFELFDYRFIFGYLLFCISPPWTEQEQMVETQSFEPELTGALMSLGKMGSDTKPLVKKFGWDLIDVNNYLKPM